METYRFEELEKDIQEKIINEYKESHPEYLTGAIKGLAAHYQLNGLTESLGSFFDFIELKEDEPPYTYVLEELKAIDDNLLNIASSSVELYTRKLEKFKKSKKYSKYGEVVNIFKMNKK